MENNGKSYMVTAPTPEREAKLTPWLLLSISICVFGNSFLYGYNIGVVNSPGPIIKVFYAQTYKMREGVETMYRHETGGLYYKYAHGNKTAGITEGNFTAAATTTIATLVVNASGQVVSDPASYNVTEKKVPRDPFLAYSKQELEDDNFIEIMWSVTVAIFVLFGMIGAFGSGKVADTFGRKKGMIMITVLMFFAGVLGGIPIITRSPECLILSRAFVGLHCGINVSLASLYLAEIAPKKIRGAVGTCHQLFITIGILWSMVLGLPDLIGTWENWPWLFVFNAVPAAVCLIVFPFCPESPRYLLIKKNDEDGAKKALVRLLGYEDVADEMEEMRVEARRATSVKTFTLKQLLTSPELKLPIIIAVVCQVAQQWSGINAAMSYSSFIFKQANVAEKSIPYVVVGQGAINVLATLVAVPLMEKAGRRPLLIWPMGGMVVSFLVLTICLNLLTTPGFEESQNVLAIVCIIAMLSYVIGFALGLGPIPFIVVGEIFRQEPRAAAMSFSLAFNWICNFILMLSFRFIQKSIEAYTYLIFIVILVASIIFIFFFVPETKNKTFDEIAQSISFGRANRSNGGLQNAEELQPMGAQKV